MRKELICLTCPVGCRITAEADDHMNLTSVTGNGCKRGAVYAKQELVSPKRMLTSLVRVKGGDLPVVSVKTEEAIPKGLLFDVMEDLSKIELVAPVQIGDIVLRNVRNSHVNVVASKNILQAEH
ncbi:MAG: DUF1667 domain-containing protein [Anaerofustis sp.]